MMRKCFSILSGSNRKSWRTVPPRRNWTRCYDFQNLYHLRLPRVLPVSICLCSSCFAVRSRCLKLCSRAVNDNICPSTSGRRSLITHRCITSGLVARRSLLIRTDRQTTTVMTMIGVTILSSTETTSATVTKSWTASGRAPLAKC